MGSIVATTVAIMLIALGGADFLFIERPQMNLYEDETATTASLPASSPPVIAVKKGTSKKNQVNVGDVLEHLGLTTIDTNEDSLLSRAAPQTVRVEKRVLMKDNDRAALFAWLENSESLALFSALKQSLQQTFTPNVTDLRDERIEPQEGAPRDVLSFTDPPGSERVIIVRIRTRLYEFHVANGNEALVQSIIDALGGA